MNAIFVIVLEVLSNKPPHSESQLDSEDIQLPLCNLFSNCRILAYPR